jgi:hypothetical protein
LFFKSYDQGLNLLVGSFFGDHHKHQ